MDDKNIRSMRFFIDKREKRHAYPKRQFDHTQYSLDGLNYFTKSKFLLVIAQKILKHNPCITLHELEKILPHRARFAKTIRTLREWKSLSLDMQKRYNCDDDEILQDVNGERFLITTQCTKEFFDSEIIPLLEKRFGWNVYIRAK